MENLPQNGGLTAQELEEICRYIQKYPEIHIAKIFGSRALGTYKEASDVDIAIFGEGVTDKTARDLKFDLEEESYLPYFFDVISYNDITVPSLREHIDRHGVTIYRQGWRKVKLGEIVDIIKDSYVPNNKDIIPYIGLEHIEPEKLRLNSVGNSTEVKSNKFVFKKNDILFGKLRPYFRKVVRVKFDGICSTDIWVCRAKKGILQEYLFYLMANKEFVDAADIAESGTRMPRADWDYLKDTVWSIPPLPEQKAIADILGSLDDKIELLHRQNKTLEKIAETIFRKWFVEEVSNEWEEGRLEDEFDFTMGQSPPGESYNEIGKGIIFFQGRTDFGFRFPSTRLYTTEPKKLARKFDTLISVRAPVGDINMAIEDCCIGRGLAAFRYKDNPAFYSYTYYKLRSLISYIKQFEDVGTVFGAITKEDFRKIENFIPPKELIVKFQQQVAPLDEKIFFNHKQIHTLEKLRDTLLPKLISGEVRLKM